MSSFFEKNNNNQEQPSSYINKQKSLTIYCGAESKNECYKDNNFKFDNTKNLVNARSYRLFSLYRRGKKLVECPETNNNESCF